MRSSFELRPVTNMKRIIVLTVSCLYFRCLFSSVTTSTTELILAAILGGLCCECFSIRIPIYRYISVAGCVVFFYRFFRNSSGTVEQSLLSEILTFVATTTNKINMTPELKVVLPSPAKIGFLLGDILGALTLWTVYRLAMYAFNNTHEFSSFSVIARNVKDFGYNMIKNLPVVLEQIAKEQNKLECELEHDIKSKARAIDHVNVRLPSDGLPARKILQLMETETKKENVIWQEGRVSGAVYHGISEHQDLLNKAFSLYSISNPLHPDIWPSAMKFESEIIKMVATMVDGSAGSISGESDGGYYHHNSNVCGCTTSGGTESIILAIKAHRDYYRDVKGITEPQLIACTSAHAAVNKACDMLGIKLVHVPMDEAPTYTYTSSVWDNTVKQGGYRMSIKHTIEAINSNTIMIYSSAPSYPQGVIDDIPTLSRIAQRFGVGLHVDCCLGGFVLPFAKMLQRERVQPKLTEQTDVIRQSRRDSAPVQASGLRGRARSSNRRSSSGGARNSVSTPIASGLNLAEHEESYFYGQNIPDFDFGLPGVSSMSVDTHKFGFALKGASVVLYGNKSLRQAQYFCYADWTGGMYTTPTIAGSRSGGLIAQCWASMMALGESGYKKHTQDILDTTRAVMEGVRKIPGLRLLGDSAAMIVCFASQDEKLMNTYTVSDYMTKKGWSLNTLQNPVCVHLCCTVRHVGREKEFLNDLAAAAHEAQVAASSGQKASGKAAIYGMASGMPTGPVNELLKVYNDVVLKI